MYNLFFISAMNNITEISLYFLFENSVLKHSVG